MQGSVSYHCNSVGPNELQGREDCEVGDVGEQVHQRHHQHGQSQRQRQVPAADIKTPVRGTKSAG